MSGFFISILYLNEPPLTPMRKVLALIFILATFLLLFFVRHKQEKIARTDGNRITFESGNFARIYEDGQQPGVSNPAHHRTYAKFSFDGTQIEQGLFVDGEFLPDNDKIENTRYFLYTLNGLILALYFIFFFRADYIHLRDWYKNRTAVPYTAMNSNQLSKALAGKMSCDRCNTSPDFSLQKETMVQGMIFLEGNCNVCKEAKKVRVK
jgi:hypothetical protein